MGQEGDVSEERRKHERQASFGMVRVFTRDDAGGEKHYTFMLRDRSYLGLGAVYIGLDELDMDRTYYLDGGEGNEPQTMRLVWKRQVADYVYTLGFLIDEP